MMVQSPPPPLALLASTPTAHVLCSTGATIPYTAAGTAKIAAKGTPLPKGNMFHPCWVQRCQNYRPTTLTLSRNVDTVALPTLLLTHVPSAPVLHSTGTHYSTQLQALPTSQLDVQGPAAPDPSNLEGGKQKEGNSLLF